MTNENHGSRIAVPGIPHRARGVRAPRLAAASCLVLIAVASTACNVIDLALGRGAELTEMTPGGNVSTTGSSDPPLETPIKVRFPLNTRQTIENAPSPLALEAELWWGGAKQDTIKRTIDHVYSRSENGFF